MTDPVMPDTTGNPAMPAGTAEMRAEMLCMIADLVQRKNVPTANALFLGVIAVELGTIADALSRIEAALAPDGPDQGGA